VPEQATAVKPSWLNGNELDVHTGRFCEGAQITGVGGEDVVSVTS